MLCSAFKPIDILLKLNFQKALVSILEQIHTIVAAHKKTFRLFSLLEVILGGQAVELTGWRVLKC